MALHRILFASSAAYLIAYTILIIYYIDGLNFKRIESKKLIPTETFFSIPEIMPIKNNALIVCNGTYSNARYLYTRYMSYRTPQ